MLCKLGVACRTLWVPAVIGLCAGETSGQPVPELVSTVMQTDSTSAKIQSGSDSLALLMPHRVRADTGRMAWGRDDFSSFTDADYCDRAIIAMLRELGRVPHPTLYQSEQDSLPTAARLIAQRCGVHLTVPDVPPATLWGLIRLSLSVAAHAADAHSTIGNARAAAAVERLRALAATPTERAWVLTNAIRTYLTAPIPRLDAARVLLRELEAQQPAVMTEQFQGQVAFMLYWIRVNLDSARHHATQATKIAKSLTPQERDDTDLLLTPYFTLLDLANDAGDLQAQQDILTQTMNEVGEWRRGSDNLLNLMQAQFNVRQSLYGKTAVPLEGEHWFNTGDTPHPTPGKISLLLRLDHMCGSGCRGIYALIRDLHQRYGNDLDITVITETRGFTIGTNVIPVDEEIRRVSEYFLKEQQLPVSLLIDERPYTKGRNGRVQYQTTAIGRIFQGLPGMNAILIDRNQTIRWIGEFRSIKAFQIQQMVARWVN
jgi:hypothetical protein